MVNFGKKYSIDVVFPIFTICFLKLSPVHFFIIYIFATEKRNIVSAFQSIKCGRKNISPRQIIEKTYC